MQVVVRGSRWHHVANNGTHLTVCDCVWSAPVGRAARKPICPRCRRVLDRHPDNRKVE